MATTFPTSLQDLDATRGTSSNTLSSPSHVTHHTTEDDTIEALQAKVGVDNSAVTSSIDYKLTNTSSVNPGHKHTLTASGFTDVAISGLADGNGLVYSASAGKWVNASTATADASTTVKGVTKMSVAPASASNPIAVGDNDGRVPTQSENDALVGTSGSPSSTNKYVTNDDTGTSGASKVLRLDGSGKIPALDASQVTNLVACQKVGTFTTNVTVSATTTETDILSMTVTGGLLGTSNAVIGEINGAGDTANQFQLRNSQTVTIRLKYGSTTVASLVLTNSSGVTFEAAFARIAFGIYAAGTTSSQDGYITLQSTHNSSSFSSSTISVASSDSGSAAEDSTANKTLAVTVQYGASSVNDSSSWAAGYAILVK